MIFEKWNAGFEEPNQFYNSDINPKEQIEENEMLIDNLLLFIDEVPELKERKRMLGEMNRLQSENVRLEGGEEPINGTLITIPSKI